MIIAVKEQTLISYLNDVMYTHVNLRNWRDYNDMKMCS